MIAAESQKVLYSLGDLSNSVKGILWSRRELHPGPQHFQNTFVHVRSRRIPGD